MFSDASLYTKHQELQTRDTKCFITSTIKKMDWRKDEEELVMDIGCGPGNSTRNLLLPLIPKGKLSAIDIIPDMIEFAKKNNAHPKIEYFVADIQERATVAKWQNSVSKIISVYCFHWMKDENQAFKNIYYILKPGGEAALLFTITSQFWACLKELVENSKWNKYLKNADPHIPESHFKKYDSFYYKQMLVNLGFIVKISQEEKRLFTYRGINDCKDSISSICGLTKHIPSELREEFGEDLVESFIKYNSSNSEGKPAQHYTTITLLIKKPTTSTG